MLRQLLFGISLSSSLVSAVTTTRYSSTTIVQCRTQSGSGGVAPTPIPTSNGATTVTSIRTEAAVTAPSTVGVNAPTVTVTASTSTTWENTVATVTSSFFTTWVGFDSTVATASWTVTSCTNGVSPSTVTSYTGTYKPVPGQNTALPTIYPTQVFCSTTVSSFLTLFPTSTSGATTITNTPTITVAGPIIATSTITITWGTDVVYASTLTSTTRRFSLAGRPTTVRTACQPTTTTTLAAKCAPTNIIGSIDNVGLVSGRYAQNISVIYLREDKYLDPSLCCQLCQENEGCGAVMTGMNEFCGLLYVGGPRGNATCDFTFTYGTQANVFPGQGLLVQSGCGSIEYEKRP